MRHLPDRILLVFRHSSRLRFGETSRTPGRKRGQDAKNPEGAVTEVITLSGLSTRLVLQPGGWSTSRVLKSPLGHLSPGPRLPSVRFEKHIRFDRPRPTRSLKKFRDLRGSKTPGPLVDRRRCCDVLGPTPRSSPSRWLSPRWRKRPGLLQSAATTSRASAPDVVTGEPCPWRRGEDDVSRRAPSTDPEESRPCARRP